MPKIQKGSKRLITTRSTQLTCGPNISHNKGRYREIEYREKMQVRSHNSKMWSLGNLCITCSGECIFIEREDVAAEYLICTASYMSSDNFYP